MRESRTPGSVRGVPSNQFAANRCGIQRLFVLSLQIFGNDKHLICCG